jgi:CO dehydrogenase maturation factor
MRGSSASLIAMKLVVAGKGGTGKTTLAGTIARFHAKRGFRVLAVDGDASPNLAITLGLPAERWDEGQPLPRDGMIAGLGRRTPAELAAPYLTTVDDGLSLMIVARAAPDDADTGCLTLAHRGMRALIEATASDYDSTVLDTEGTPEHLARGTSGFADLMLLIVEPSRASLEAGGRMGRMSKRLGVPRVSLVANKLRTATDERTVRSFSSKHDVEIIGSVPFDESLQAAERKGVSPVDDLAAGESVALTAMATIAAACEPQRPRRSV